MYHQIRRDHRRAHRRQTRLGHHPADPNKDQQCQGDKKHRHPQFQVPECLAHLRLIFREPLEILNLLVRQQRSVQLVRGSELNPELEPRIRWPQDTDAAINAEHPFFWAGSLLIDTGTRPKVAEEAAAANKVPGGQIGVR